MKKSRWIKVLLTFLLPLTILIIFLVNGGCERMMGYPSKEEMIKVLETQEAKDVIEKSLKNLENNALTDEGVIRTYAIDYNSIKWNPMGGIMFQMNINGNESLIIHNIMSNYGNGLEIDASGISEQMSNILEKNKEKEGNDE